MKSKNPSSVKLDEETAQWLAGYCKDGKALTQVAAIAMAVKELKRKIEGGCDVGYDPASGEFKLVCPPSIQADLDIATEEDRRRSLKSKKP